jgi:hypothetical protein
MRSREELLAASGYAGRPREFDELLRILDAELRLVTPTDPEGAQGDDPEPARAAAAGQFYQLTHDYLVPALREWLLRKQRETRRGRAELVLAERAALWNGKPEWRQLPIWWEWLNILLLTRHRLWTAPQRRMMRAARWTILLKMPLLMALVGGLVAGLCVGVIYLVGQTIYWVNYYGNHDAEARRYVRSLTQTETPEVTGLVECLTPEARRWADPVLAEVIRETPADSREHLHAALALLPVDPGQADYLCERMLTATPDDLLVIRPALEGHGEDVRARLWDVADDTAADPDRRLRALCALAGYDPASPRWAGMTDYVVGRLVAEPPPSLGAWTEAWRPMAGQLAPALRAVVADNGRTHTERCAATCSLAVYAGHEPDTRALLCRDGAVRQQAIVRLYAQLAENTAAYYGNDDG